jgi:SPP1 family predicted phage head-tail adaptor
MRAGRLRQRVTVQEKSVTKNAYGEEIITWEDYHTAWAAVEPVRGQEFYEMEMAGADVSTRIVLRWPGDGLSITPAMRVSYDGRYYDIETVIHVDERHRELHLMCREIVSDEWEGGD